ncbi:MAG TPA: DUF2917 domain-containing protein [Anaeromyxobacter sp.]|nr:DUF2917 domain-containing protein [Anaeromyxobacter sp.]
MTRRNEADRTNGMVERGTGRGAPAGRRALGINEVLRLPAGGAVRVEAGQVVITVEGDAVDHVLDEGEELELPRRGRALAWALAPSQIGLSVPTVRGWRRRSWSEPSASRSEARPSGARPWPAPRPS